MNFYIKYINPMSEIKTALISVWDKSNLDNLARKLSEVGIEIIFDPLNVSDDEVDEVITIIRESMN